MRDNSREAHEEDQISRVADGLRLKRNVEPRVRELGGGGGEERRETHVPSTISWTQSQPRGGNAHIRSLLAGGGAKDLL